MLASSSKSLPVVGRRGTALVGLVEAPGSSFCRLFHSAGGRRFAAREDEKTRLGPDDYRKIVEGENRGIFRVLDIGLPRPFNPKREKRSDRIVVKATPREKLMQPTQDWPSVWPAQRTFHPAAVPLPIRQGFCQLRSQTTPGKYANAELMKIPNFLHLTPPAIARHCAKLKQFCTTLPKELEDPKEMELNFPMVEITTDYLNASSSIRDLRSRIVTLKFRLSCLPLDAHARDKFLRLVGDERYDVRTDVVTLTSDRLPHRKQNVEYCEYLVKALFFESTKREEWEDERLEQDLHLFQPEEGEAYAGSLTRIMNEGENPQSIDAYKSEVRKHLGFKEVLPTYPEVMN